MRVHFQSSEGWTACGTTVNTDWLTSDRDDVTCKSCVRTWTPSEKRRWANKKARAQEGYADPDFRGTGALSCYACGRKIVEHPGWPCPFRPLGAVAVDR